VCVWMDRYLFDNLARIGFCVLASGNNMIEQLTVSHAVYCIAYATGVLIGQSLSLSVPHCLYVTYYSNTK
jgi:hypothetical protein